MTTTIECYALSYDTSCDGWTPPRILGLFTTYEAAETAMRGPKYRAHSQAMCAVEALNPDKYIHKHTVTVFDTPDEFDAAL